MLVHFPIALILLGFIADVASLVFKKEACLSKAGFYLLIVGVISAIIALLSGILFTSEMGGSAGEVKETHELFAWITLILVILTSVLRTSLMIKKKEESNLKWIVLGLYGLAAISVSVTGFYGGTLVYNYMLPL
jgi:uncharacterized membrane protein